LLNAHRSYLLCGEDSRIRYRSSAVSHFTDAANDYRQTITEVCAVL